MTPPSQYQTQLAQAVADAAAALDSTFCAANATVLERPRSEAHGDFSCPLPLTLAKPLRQNPRQIAEQLHAQMQLPPFIADSHIAGPGFINFTIADDAKIQVIHEILAAQEAYGRQPAREETVLLEFVSANPTGPLHVGHGRACVYGDALANLLEAAGVTVRREYYINDAGRQMDILTASVWLRHWQANADAPMPAGAYQGDYLIKVAEALKPLLGGTQPPADNLMAQAEAAADADAAADLLVTAARDGVGDAAAYATLRQSIGTRILDEVIKQEMRGLQVNVDAINFFSETTLHEGGKVAAAVEALASRGELQEKDGALWFKSSAYGDEKDRVVRRSNGELTYFAADIAYHADKLSRPHEPQHNYTLINVLGADHHGYVPRLRAAVQALGHPADRLQTEIIQFVALFEDGKRLKMSTRAGEFITLSQLVEEVGAESARYYYLNRKNDQHLDFDLAEARAKKRTNPVYYLQYTNARVFSIIRKWEEEHNGSTAALAKTDTTTLAQNAAAVRLCANLIKYPQCVGTAAAERAPHLLTTYLHDLASALNVVYEEKRVLPREGEAAEADMAARLALLWAGIRVLNNGATLLGLTLPEKMANNVE